MAKSKISMKREFASAALESNVTIADLVNFHSEYLSQNHSSTGLNSKERNALFSRIEDLFRFKIKEGNKWSEQADALGDALSICKDVISSFYDDSLQRQTISFGCGGAILNWVVLPALGKLHARMEDLCGRQLLFKVNEVRTERIRSLIKDGAIHFGVSRKPIKRDCEAVEKKAADRRSQAQIASQLIGKFRYVCLKPKSSGDVNLPFAVLREHVINDRGNKAEDICRNLKGHRVGLVCDSYAQVVEALNSGGYATVVPDFAVQKLRAHNLILVPLPILHEFDDQHLFLEWKPAVKTALVVPGCREDMGGVAIAKTETIFATLIEVLICALREELGRQD